MEERGIDMDIVKPANESNFSAKFKREKNKRQKANYTFEEGEMWVEVLLAQLAPNLSEISEKSKSEYQNSFNYSKFDVESNLARILIEIAQFE